MYFPADPNLSAIEVIKSLGRPFFFSSFFETAAAHIGSVASD